MESLTLLLTKILTKGSFFCSPDQARLPAKFVVISISRGITVVIIISKNIISITKNITHG